MTSNPLFPEERAQMLRVNLAGEYGARSIYQGQLRVLKHHACAPVLQEMLDQEAVHLRFFEQACVQERVLCPLSLVVWRRSCVGYGHGSSGTQNGYGLYHGGGNGD
jgi:ubiquinone biosynthesis monooxygenase Coq7